MAKLVEGQLPLAEGQGSDTPEDPEGPGRAIQPSFGTSFTTSASRARS
jgi:hypothetical protein